MSEKAGCFRVSENFDTKALAERASREMSAMGYDVKLEKTEKGFRVAYEKDIGGMDTFLGRWQNSVAEIENSGGDLKVSFHGHRVADKLIAFVLGGFFYRGLKISGFRDIVRYVDFVDLLVIFS